MFDISNHVYCISKGKQFKVVLDNLLSIYNNGHMGNWDIHKSVNKFLGDKRTTEYLTEIVEWYVDADQEPKKKIQKRIKESPILPTRIVESKNGYHLFWGAKDATVKNYDSIITGLRKHFNGDPGAKGLTRMFRASGFLQYKYKEPYLVNEIRTTGRKIEESLMIDFFDIDIKKKHDIPILVYSGNPIRDLIEDLGLIKQGSNYPCPNPEHSSQHKRPSLHVYHNTNSFYCFSCGLFGGPDKFKELMTGWAK